MNCRWLTYACGFGALVQPVVPHVANDADDRPVRALVAADAHPPADRILARKNLRSGRFANHHDRLLALGIRIGQQPPPPQRHAHDLEVVDRDRVELHRRRVRAVLHAALDVKPAPIVVATQRDLGGKRGALDSRHGVQPPQHVVVKREHGLVLRPARPDERDAGGDDPVRVESGIGREQPIDGAVHQSRARDEQERNRHLRHHEQLARAERAAAARLPSLPQHRLQIGPRRRPRRHEPERHQREHRDARADEQHPGIGRRRAEARHQHRRVRASSCKPHRASATPVDRRDRRHHERLGQQLPHEAEAIRPDRRPHRELALAIRRARDEQPRDVRAGDEQQKRDGADEHLQRPPHRARDFVTERADDGRGLLVVGRMLEPQRGLHARELRRGLRDRPARPQQRDRLQVLTRSARRRSAHGVAERSPQLRRRVVMRGNHGLERRGHHAGDEVRHAVQRDGRSRDVRARTESAPPQAVRQHHDTQPRRRVLGLIEVAPERRVDAEHAEVVPRDTHPVELRGAAFARRSSAATRG